MEEKNTKKKCSCDGSKCNCGNDSDNDSKKSGCKSGGCSCHDNVLKKARPELIDLLKSDLL